MGTSKAYGGPKWPGVNPAVGDATSSSNPTEQKLSVAVAKFANAYRNYITSSEEAGSGGRSTATGGRKFSGGGGGGAARSRVANSGSRLAHFLSTAGRSGLTEALKQFDLSELRDKPLDEFLDAVADRLSSDGGLLDDESLNRAMAMTIDELAKDIKSVDELDTLLSGGILNNIEEILQIYYANILANNFEQKEYGFVREKIPRENTKKFFNQAREIIKAIVRDELSKDRDLSSLDWNSPEGQKIADEINQEVLKILISHE